MARPARPWFRFYVEAIYDRKLRRLTPAQRWLWVVVLSAGRQSCIPGFLLVSEHEALLVPDLADMAGMPAKEVEAALPLFERSGMLERDENIGAWCIPSWNDRQYESDDVTARTRKFRERSEEPVRNVPKPSKERRRNTPETETESESKPESVTIAPKTGARRPDPLFNAVTDACGIEYESLTGSARGALNRACAELRGAKANPSDVPVRAANYHATYPDTALTPSALAKHWPALSKPPSNGHGNLSKGGQSLARVLAAMEAKDAS